MSRDAAFAAAGGRYAAFREHIGALPADAPVFSVSDNMTTAGFGTFAGSRILEGHRPVFDAAAVERMEAAGGILIGKTNLDEFGSGCFSVSSGYGVPRNPFDAECSCGGPCGGAACAAALIGGQVSLAAGGSVGQAAGCCGVYGLTPTYGRVSRHGVIDSGSSSGGVGLMAADPRDIARCLPVISGRDPRDPASCVQPDLRPGGRLGSIAVPADATEGVSGAVRLAFASALELLESMGAEIVTVDVPALRYAHAAHQVLTAAEASTNVARYCGMRYGRQDGDLSLGFDDYFTGFRTEHFGEEAKLMTLLGTYLRLEGSRDRYYGKALEARSQVIDAYRELFGDHDAVASPSMLSAAPRFDEVAAMTASERQGHGRPGSGPALAGLPHLSVPCGYDDGMPLGLQLAAAHWDEGLLLAAAEAWDDAFAVRTAEAVP